MDDFKTGIVKMPNARTVVYDTGGEPSLLIRCDKQMNDLLRSIRAESCPKLELIVWGRRSAWLYSSADGWKLFQEEWAWWTWEWIECE